MRTTKKQRGQDVYEDIEQIHTDPPNSPVVIDTAQRLKSTDFEESQGEVIHNFRRRRNAGDLMPMTNWYQFSRAGSVNGSYAVSHSTGSYSWTPFYSFTDSWNILPEDISGWLEGTTVDFDPYVQEAAAKIYNSGFDVLTFVAELHKTIDLFANIGNSINSLIENKTFEQSWLEYRYGWRLVYYDIVSLVELVNSIGDGRTRHSQRVGESFTFDREVRKDFTYLSSYGTVTYDDTLDVSVRGSVVADIIPPKLRLNPVQTGWELIRWTFIIDWFIQIGRWISTISFLVFSSNWVASTGYYATLTRKVKLESVTPNTGWTIDNATMSGTIVASLTLRKPATIPLYPTVSINLDWQKVLDITSILVSKIRTNRQRKQRRSRRRSTRYEGTLRL